MSKKDPEVKSQLDKLADIFDPPLEGLRRNPAFPTQQSISERRLSYQDAHRKEDELIHALDDIKAMRRLAPTLKKIINKKISVDAAIKESSHEALLTLMKMAFTEGNPKVKAQVLMHLLGMAGHSTTQKHQIERIDPHTPKEALLSLIAGAKSDLEAEGIKVEDSREQESEAVSAELLEDEGYET